MRRALVAHRLVPGDLVLELTETALLNAANSTINSLRQLRDDGVGIAIDDFGTGYASLRYLATLPVSALKVDGPSPPGSHDEICRKIVTAVTGLAADPHMDCVIEGVETAEQAIALPKGVQLLVGSFGRPAAAKDLDVLRLTATLAGTVSSPTVNEAPHDDDCYGAAPH